GDLGPRLPRRHTLALEGPGRPRPGVVPRARRLPGAVLAPQLVPAPGDDEEGAALRAALPGAAQAHRRGAEASPARAGPPLLGHPARGVRRPAALEGLPQDLGGRGAALRQEARGLSALAAYQPQHAVLVGLAGLAAAPGRRGQARARPLRRDAE